MSNQSAINRRTFIKGLGLATGVGASMLGSRVALGRTDQAPLRVLFVALQHGWGRDESFSDSIITGTEYNFNLPPQLKAFEAIKDDLVIVDGVRGTGWGNAHDVSYSDILTAAVPWDENSSSQLGNHFPEPMGPSLDYVLAQHSGKPALRLSAGYRSWGRSSNPMCFDMQARVLDPYTNAIDAYDAIIGPIKDSAKPPDLTRDAMRANLFEFLDRDAQRMQQRLYGAERLKIEGYLSALRDLGERIMKQPDVQISEADIPDRPMRSPTFEAGIDHYLELIQLAFRADTHRVAVLGFGQGVNEWQWRDKQGMIRQGNPWGSDFHHEIAHHDAGSKPDPDYRHAFEGWVDWYAQKITQLATALKMTPDVDGSSLLDNTLIVLTGEVGTGTHDRRRKMHILIGGGDRLKRGRWIEVPSVNPRQRDGVFLGGQTRAGEEVVHGVNYGPNYSVLHTADVLAAIGRLAGLNLNSFGLPANNKAPMRLDLSA